MKFFNYEIAAWPRQTIGQLRIPSGLTGRGLRLGLFVLSSLGVGLAVIISTYYVNNVKLLIGLVGGLAFVLLTMRWPEFGILCLVALLSGLIPMGSLPALHLGPISIQIPDVMLLVILGLVFLRATTQRGFVLFGSPLMLPLLLFIGAFLLSAVNAVLIYGVSPNLALRTVRVLSLWTVFIATLQLVRDKQALRRLLFGLLILTGILLAGVFLQNRLSPLLYIEMVATGTGAQASSGFTRFYYDGDMVLYAMIPVTVASLATIKKGNQLWRIGLLGFLLYWVLMTYFREYWLTLLTICILLLGFLSSRERMRLLKRMAPVAIAGVLIVVVLLVVVLVAGQATQVERIVQPLAARWASLGQNVFDETSLQWRALENRYALQQISLHPVLGIGLGNAYRPPLELEAGGTSYEWTFDYMENGYLYIATYMGLIGLLPFLWLCAAYLLRVFRHQHEIRDEGLRAVYLGFGAAFLGMMACNFVSPTFVFGTRLIFFPLSMAISEVILRVAREQEARQ
ncbi:MAG: O-antigen ligase family protein [Anaerolineales bacterium]